MSLLERYQAELLRLRRSLLGIAGISMLASLCMLAIPLYLFQVYDRVLFSRHIETLLALSFIAALVLLTFCVLDIVRSNLLARVAAQFEANLAGPIMAGELGHPEDTYTTTTNYLTVLSKVIASDVTTSIFDLPVMLLFLLMVFLVHPVLGSVILVTMLMLFAIAIIGELATSRLAKQAQDASHAALQRQNAAYRLHEVVRAMGMFREVIRSWAQEQSRFVATNIQAQERGNVFSALSKTVRQLAQIALIGLGAWLVLQNEVTAGVIFASSIIGSRALAPIEAIVGGWRNLKAARLAMRALEARLAKLSLPEVHTALPRPKGAIGIEGLIYAPPLLGAAPVLRGISGQIAAGQAIAIIGPSGAGKSTLARCIVGYLKPTRGKVTLDGQDLASWDPVAKGMHVGYLPQTVEFFEGTVAQNIARLRTQDPPEAVVEAARFTGVHDMILTFPNGYDTPISSIGFQPSGGQRQLIGLARAFYGAPSVVVLDEPNANLDADGEKLLAQTIRRAKEVGTTVIVVTQRLSVLQHMDKVLVLKQGAVEQFTDPATIMKNNNVHPLNRRAAAAGQAPAPAAPENEEEV